MRVHDSLVEIRKLLAKPENWTQGPPARDRNGMVCFPESPEAVCWCLMGAVMRVMSVRSHSALTPDYRHPGVIPVHRVIAGVLGRVSVVAWHEVPGRTHAEVLALIDKAILSCR